MHRRTFVRTLGAVVAAPLLACATTSGASTAAPGTRKLKRVGVQLYSLRDDGRRNLDQTLGAIANAGYDDVEMLMSNANFGASPAQARAMLDKHGLKAPSTHMNAASLANMEKTLEEARILGHRYLFLAGLPNADKRSLAGFQSWGDRLNRAGEVARKADVWIGFHNHGDDFVSFDGKVGYDALMDRTDPALVRMQLDIGNAAMGGQDPVAYMEKYGDRYWSFHIKDVPSMRATHDAELGKGILDIRGVMSRIKNVDDKLVYVEQESYPGAPIDSVKRDYTYIMNLTF